MDGVESSLTVAVKSISSLGAIPHDCRSLRRNLEYFVERLHSSSDTFAFASKKKGSARNKGQSENDATSADVVPASTNMKLAAQSRRDASAA